MYVRPVVVRMFVVLVDVFLCLFKVFFHKCPCPTSVWWAFPGNHCASGKNLHDLSESFEQTFGTYSLGPFTENPSSEGILKSGEVFCSAPLGKPCRIACV